MTPSVAAPGDTSLRDATTSIHVLNPQLKRVSIHYRQKAMASSADKDSDERKELKMKQEAFVEKERAAFEKKKGSDKEFQRIRRKKTRPTREKVAVCVEEHANVRYQNAEQTDSVRMLKETMQRIQSYSKSQEQEKDQALKKVASLRDEILALRQISAETQQRQLNEIQPSSSGIKQPPQHTGRPYSECY